MTAAPAFHRFKALGTLAVVGTADPRRLREVVEVVAGEVRACDVACSRFREDSELSRINAPSRSTWETVSSWLVDAVSTGLRAAEDTGGLVDPTIGQCLIDLGYDRSFEELHPDRPLAVAATHVPAWTGVRVDPQRGRVFLPAGVRLDLGATAKARCADRAAERAAAVARCGVLVSLGGDMAVAGAAPDGGWVVRVTDRADTAPDADVPGQTVAVHAGGLATSGTAARRWAVAGQVRHHLVDPRLGSPAAEVWKTVTVAAATCVAANVYATAAVVLGDDAPAWLAARRVDARLVTPAGRVVTVGAWPAVAAAVTA